jgi:hypothetical protein
MKKIFLILAIVLIAIGIIIFEPFRSEPPAPNVEIDGLEVATTEGSFCWMGMLRGQCVDYVYASPIEMAQKHNPAPVSPNEKITIEFTKEPASETLEVSRWIGENNSQAVPIENGGIQAPNEKGVYVYHVIAQWKQGDGNWAFSVEVE